MKSQLASIISPRGVGVYIERDCVHACLVASMPLGDVQLNRDEEPVGADGPVAATTRLLDRMLGQHSERLPLAVCLGADVSYFTTRPMQSNSKDVSARSLLREALRSPEATVDQMAVSVATMRPEQRNLAGIFACDDQMIAALATGLGKLNLRLVKVEPVASALLRSGVSSSASRAKVVVHVYLEPGRILAVTTAKGRPITQRRGKLPLGDEAAAILNIVRSLVTINETCGVDSHPDLVQIHGRAELPQLLDMDWLRGEMKSRIEWLDGPSPAGDSVALSVAKGCLESEEEEFDLAAAYKQQPTLREIFPWREVAVQLMLVAVMAWFLIIRLADVQTASDRAAIQNSQNLFAAATIPELEKEKRELEQRLASAERFLKGRIVWTRCLRNITKSLPDNIQLTTVQGASELPQPKSKGKSKEERKLVLTGAVTLAPGGVIPLEIDRLLNALRADTSMKKAFPLIELSELKQFENAQKESQALFTVVCLPKARGKK